MATKSPCAFLLLTVSSSCCWLFVLLLSVANAEFNPDTDCGLPAEPGLCRAFIPRFYYDATAKKCQRFIYGGCGANANNFKNETSCNELCANSNLTTLAPTTTTTTAVPTLAPGQDASCLLLSDVGNCSSTSLDFNLLASQTKYFYNAKIQLCQPFMYCGVGGNANRHDSNDTCMAACSAVKPSTTGLPTTTTVSSTSSEAATAQTPVQSLSRSMMAPDSCWNLLGKLATRAECAFWCELDYKRCLAYAYDNVSYSCYIQRRACSSNLLLDAGIPLWKRF